MRLLKASSLHNNYKVHFVLFFDINNNMWEDIFYKSYDYWIKVQRLPCRYAHRNDGKILFSVMV